jgi:hypothetical protein
MRRCFEMAGAFEPTLVINQWVGPLFDIAQRTDRIDRNFFPIQGSIADVAPPLETIDFREPTKKSANLRMSLRQSHLARSGRL